LKGEAEHWQDIISCKTDHPHIENAKVVTQNISFYPCHHLRFLAFPTRTYIFANTYVHLRQHVCT
ncbi:MAG: hypothetical protein K6C30_00615, partial [Bacteroidaceae bacterium]|nr:hypothetical protein [Bacteroidaceae bacterium]